MKFKGDLKVLGGIAAGQYLTIDPTGNILGSISSGGGGGSSGDISTLVYQGITMNKMDPNYISNNYYEVDAGSITPGQTTGQNGPVPGDWTSPFIINNKFLNNNMSYIINNMNVKITDSAKLAEYIGILQYDSAIFTSSSQTIYNFIDSDTTTPHILEHETSTYTLSLLLYYIQPSEFPLDKYNFNKNTNSYPKDNAILIKKNTTEMVNSEYFNIKLNTMTMETDIPGIFKIFIINTANLNNTPQQFSYPPLYDDDGNSLSIETDTFISAFDGDQYILVTNFPIIETNITIVSYVSLP